MFEVDTSEGNDSGHVVRVHCLKFLDDIFGHTPTSIRSSFSGATGTQSPINIM